MDQLSKFKIHRADGKLETADLTETLALLLGQMNSVSARRTVTIHPLSPKPMDCWYKPFRFTSHVTATPELVLD